MDKITIRLLRAEEIECRIGTVNEKGASLLLFKDARVDQKILDETFGMFGWRRSHQIIGENLYCTVEVWDSQTGQWIAKQDVGTTSSSEKEKGQASDSFKRACFNWGIGRELYTAPFIWIPAGKLELQKRDNRYAVLEKFHVADIGYGENREIVRLEIRNASGVPVFRMNMNPPRFASASLQPWQIAELQSELERTGVVLDMVLERYGLTDLSDMTEKIYNQAMRSLQRSKPKAGKQGAA